MKPLLMSAAIVLSLLATGCDSGGSKEKINIATPVPVPSSSWSVHIDKYPVLGSNAVIGTVTNTGKAPQHIDRVIAKAYVNSTLIDEGADILDATVTPGARIGFKVTLNIGHHQINRVEVQVI